jgi:hypothetical protein
LSIGRFGFAAKRRSYPLSPKYRSFAVFAPAGGLPCPVVASWVPRAAASRHNFVFARRCRLFLRFSGKFEPAGANFVAGAVVPET